jgi:uncharacterized membrane protein
MPADRSPLRHREVALSQGESGEQRGNIPDAVARNIASIHQWRSKRRAARSFSDRVADAVSRFAGSMPFVYVHLCVFGGWILANLGLVPGVTPWDPSMVVLAMIASVEAIFLSTFVLINQNQMAAEADERAELDLQVGLLNERETTRLIAMTEAIAAHLGVSTGVEHDIGDLRQDTEPDVILEAVTKNRDDT